MGRRRGWVAAFVSVSVCLCGFACVHGKDDQGPSPVIGDPAVSSPDASPQQLMHRYLLVHLARAGFIGLKYILPLHHKSGPLGLYAALTVSDLFFVFFVEFYGVF